MATEADLHVAPNGDDGAPGTPERPLATLAGARDRVRQLRAGSPGRPVRVWIRGGTYRVTATVVFGLADGAPEGAPTVYAAQPGETPVLSGGVPVEGWTRRSDAIWEADLPQGLATVNALFDAEGLLPRARGRGFVPEEGGTPWTMRYPEDAVPEDLDPANAELAIVPHYPWAMNVLPLAGHEPAERRIQTAVPGTYPLDAPRFGRFPDGTAWIENVLAVLDQPGEWCVDRRTRKLYLLPRGERPEGVLAPAVTEILRVEGRCDPEAPADEPVRNLTFRGLTFTHADRWSWEPDRTGWGLQHDWEMFDRPTAAVRLRGAEGCTLEQCRVVHSGGTGIRLDLHCQRNRVTHCQVAHVGGAGVLLAGYGPGTRDVNRDNEVAHCRIHHVGRLLWSSLGIFVWQSGHNRIAHNLVHHTAYTAIAVTGRIVWRRDGNAECARTIRWPEVDGVYPDRPERLTWPQRERFLHGRGNRVEHNEVHDAMEILGDGNCVYVSGTGGGNVVRGNLLHDVDSYNVNASIRCDDDQHGTVIEGNVCLRNCGEGFISKGNNRVVNNVFADIRSRTRAGVDNPHRRGYIVFPYGQPQGSEIQRNVFLSCEAGQAIVSHGPTNQGGAYLWECRADHNLYWNTADPHWADAHLGEMRAHGAETHSVAAEPGFVDWRAGDLRLRPDAAARQIGFQPVDLGAVGPLDSQDRIGLD